MQPLTTPQVPWQVDEKPTEHYGVIGGLDKQIQELVEAVVLPVTHADKFKKLGIKPPKGVLLYGPPGVHLGCSHPAPLFLVGMCQSELDVNVSDHVETLGSETPKGVLLYGPPGVLFGGVTTSLLSHACPSGLGVGMQCRVTALQGSHKCL